MDKKEIEKLLKRENHIAALSLKSTFYPSAKPFYASVSKDKNGSYIALKGGLVEKEGAVLEGIEDYFDLLWVGSDKNAFNKSLSSHFNAGGLFSFTTNGTLNVKAAQAALELAHTHNKDVMFLHNDTLNIAKASGTELKSTKLPGFYKS
jgi:hypothetical protein